MNELEARRRWCPMMARSSMVFNEDTGEVSPGNSGALCNCIGSSCMLWRKIIKHDGTISVDTGHGFCGLAGRP